jgi:DNA-binding transcriptional MerR regulator
MGYPASIIPEKIFFKIGEVCDLVGVQAHVLRYWETEFTMLAPQKNRSGQRTYRRRDVEMAFRIKELLYDEMFTIAGAKKKLASEIRENSRLKIVHSEPRREISVPPPPIETVQPEIYEEEEFLEAESLENEEFEEPKSYEYETEGSSETLKQIASQLLELRKMLTDSSKEDQNFRLRKY